MPATINITEILDVYESTPGRFRVRSRERRNLELKQDASKTSIAKSLKTIAAFANCGGGHIVFGVSDRPRDLCGCDGFPDEAEIQNTLSRHLSPIPDFFVSEHNLYGKSIYCLTVQSIRKSPVIAIRDIQTSEKKAKTVLSQGVVYFRRAGQSGPATGEEFAALLEGRDQMVRESILGLLSRGKEIGFENVAVADFRQYGSSGDNVTLWVPESSAKDLKIIDRAKLVETDGAPAYQIRGNINLTTPSDKDPRKPLLPKAAARALREFMKEKFWNEFPWSETHLRKACKHLGFWSNPEGDGIHTGYEQLTKRPLYYQDGRAAVQRFASRTPEAFVEAVGSKGTRAEWRRIREKP